MNRRILIITIICVLTVLAGCGKKAEPLDLPSNEAVIRIEIITIDGAKADILYRTNRTGGSTSWKII